MSIVSDYRNKTRKKIITPGGLELEVRKLKALDYFKLGILPDTLKDLRESGAEETPGNVDPEVLEKIHKMYLTQAVIPTNELKIVDKPIGKTEDNELSFEELTDEDSNFIIKEIVNFSTDEELEPNEEEGMSPFPEEPISTTD